MESILKLKDNIWDFFEFTEYELSMYQKSYSREYYNIIREQTEVKDKQYIKVYLRADQKTVYFKKEDYDVLTFFSDLGGLIDVVLLFGWFITSIFTTRLF